MRTAIRIFFPGLAALALLLLGGCAPSAPAPGQAIRIDAQDVRFQFIYVIHGDAGYTYYDRNGERHRADLDAVAQAETVAEKSPTAEVFIFHQKHAPLLRLFHGSDGTMRQYRNGKPVRTLAYRRARDDDELRAEAALFQKYSVHTILKNCPADQETTLARVFIYFGHEIPVTGGIPYSRTRLDTSFSLSSLSQGLERFGGPGGSHAKPFSLIILSSCHGGTPSATQTLAPYAHYLLASPGELHLSYLDTRALAVVSRKSTVPADTGGDTGTAFGEAWGRAIAAESFANLRANTSTAVTLSLYDTEKASVYLEAHRDAWWREPVRGTGTAAAVYRDCAENPSFGPGGDEAGVAVYYRAPRFGPEKSAEFRSGWECPADVPYLVGRTR